jgi:hypothetical protein
MPLRNDTQFNVSTLQAMSAAYDAAIAKLGITLPDPRTAKIATKIVALVSSGESDPAALCDKVCAELI